MSGDDVVDRAVKAEVAKATSTVLAKDCSTVQTSSRRWPGTRIGSWSPLKKPRATAVRPWQS